MNLLALIVLMLLGGGIAWISERTFRLLITSALAAASVSLLVNSLGSLFERLN